MLSCGCEREPWHFVRCVLTRVKKRKKKKAGQKLLCRDGQNTDVRSGARSAFCKLQRSLSSWRRGQ